MTSRPRRCRPSLDVLTATCLVAALAVAPASAEPAATLGQADEPGSPPASPDPTERSKETLVRARQVGTAMMSWLTDVMSEDSCPEGATDPQVAASEEPKFDWAACPPISHADLTRVLIPTYVEELPTEDGWGHALEFCLAVANPCVRTGILGIRSPGSDGAWDGDTYAPGPFDPNQLDRDVVWIDGFFVRWPEKTAAEDDAEATGLSR